MFITAGRKHAETIDWGNRHPQCPIYPISDKQSPGYLRLDQNLAEARLKTNNVTLGFQGCVLIPKKIINAPAQDPMTVYLSCRNEFSTPKDNQNAYKFVQLKIHEDLRCSPLLLLANGLISALQRENWILFPHKNR